MKSPIALLRNLWIDFRRLHPDVKGLKRDFRTLESRIKDEGYGFLTRSLSTFSDAFVEGLSTGRFTCPLGFKKAKGKAIPAFLQGMLSEVFDPFTGSLRSDPQMDAVLSIYQLVQMFKKVTYTDASRDKLHAKAVDGFFKDDVQSASVILPKRESRILHMVSRLVLQDLELYDPETLPVKHGPGAVYEGVTANQKWLAMDNLVNSSYLSRFGMCTLGTYEYSDLSSDTHPIVPHKFNDPQLQASSRICKLITVPKSFKALRTITVEPTVLQFVQQGLNGHLREVIHKDPILGSCLQLTRQEKNQVLALEGSLHGNWSTIDLKSASDLLSLRMVKTVFSSKPRFFRDMMDCRSSKVQYAGRITKLRKFAGMGNALTFPVQSTVFAVIAISAILDYEGKAPSYGNVKRAARHIQVYGDDIIVKTLYASSVVEWLTTCGLIINTSKSYLDGNFKESCGSDCFRGVDIRPVYFWPTPCQSSLDASLLASMVSYSNQAWLRGYYRMAEYVRTYCEHAIGSKLPLVSASSAGLGWVSRVDASYATKWDSKLQHLLTKVLTVVPITRKDYLNGYPALYKSLLTPLIGRSPDHLYKTSRRFQLKTVWKWVPTRVGVSNLA